MSLKTQLNHGDILHCQGNRILSKLISRFTKSKLSHSALIVVLDGIVFVADSQRNGTHLRRYEEWMEKYDYRFFISRLDCELTPVQKERITYRVFSTVGFVSYDFKSLFIKQPWYLLTGRWRVKPKHKEEKRFYCSEFVAFVIGFEDSYKMHPQMLLDFLRKEECYHEFYPMGKLI